MKGRESGALWKEWGPMGRWWDCKTGLYLLLIIRGKLIRKKDFLLLLFNLPIKKKVPKAVIVGDDGEGGASRLRSVE